MLAIILSYATNRRILFRRSRILSISLGLFQFRQTFLTSGYHLSPPQARIQISMDIINRSMPE